MYAYEAAFMLSIGCLASGIFFYMAGVQKRPSLNALGALFLSGCLIGLGHAYVKGTKMETAKDVCLGIIQADENWAERPLAELRTAVDAITPNYGIAEPHHKAVQKACYDRLVYLSEHPSAIKVESLPEPTQVQDEDEHSFKEN